MVTGLGRDAVLPHGRRLDVMARQVEKIWRTSRPNITKLYEQMDKFGSRTREAARLWRDSTELFRRNGVPRDQANNLAMYEFVYLPDIEKGEEAEVLSAMQDASVGKQPEKADAPS